MFGSLFKFGLQPTAPVLLIRNPIFSDLVSERNTANDDIKNRIYPMNMSRKECKTACVRTNKSVFHSGGKLRKLIPLISGNFAPIGKEWLRNDLRERFYDLRAIIHFSG